MYCGVVASNFKGMLDRPTDVGGYYGDERSRFFAYGGTWKCNFDLFVMSNDVSYYGAVCLADFKLILHLRVSERENQTPDIIPSKVTFAK